MTKLILALTILAGIAQADTVHYDDRDKEQKQTSKPNYPSSDLYTK
ncbi:MAG: hypothetical protein U9R50_10610 [Campylobacterota bacterium]|nr:hypothetical protein [Campylobacterota bacterium]